MKKTVGVPLRILITLAVIFLVYYFTLPPINLRSPAFWAFLAEIIVIIMVVNFFSGVRQFVASLSGYFAGRASGTRQKMDFAGFKSLKFGLVALAVIIVFSLFADIVGCQLFNAKRYRDLITPVEGDFAADVAELSMSQIPVVDRDTAARLGSRKLGEMSQLVSQFEIAGNYTQINYQGSPYRVTPLVYADPIKWLFNQAEGLPAYIMVDMVTQEATLKWLDSGMKYSTSEYFFRNIARYARFKYPTKILDEPSFEIDEEGTPYWVIPTISYRIALWNGKDITGAILVNAVTGESQYCPKDEVPDWIDQLFSSDLVVQQLNFNGTYQNGFFNSLFGQKDVRRTTDGYNYLAIGDDVYLYTGITSVTSDESNIGFVLVNLRTKATSSYPVPGATEASAMASAQGQVQHLNYVATFPLLLNISDRPTYFVSLKDNAGLVKMYAFVDVEQYQVVGTGSTVAEAEVNYRSALTAENIQVEDSQADSVTVRGRVAALSSAVVGGNTYYYFTLEGADDVYAAPITVSERLPFLAAGDAVAVTYAQTGATRTVSAIAFT